MCEPHWYNHNNTKKRKSHTVPKIVIELKGGRHNIYFVSLTDTPYVCSRQKENRTSVILDHTYHYLTRLQTTITSTQ